ncbi:MAG: tetraacyldisaccharide 4'-kinase [Candidatus Latescibacteria bacterium]|nr:tetraacyldisaccharide 4'-kinase [bacterium]MBD3423398.1 tetraacyldisaccharide 4'-kinase [Candidatus Latescibacterota bacterium]
MKIINRESLAERIHRGEGWRKAFLPVRIVLSVLYGLIMSLRRLLRGAGEGKSPKGEGTRVISVGNITVGGTGKTPCCITLAGALNNLGEKTVILTRGYGSRAEKAGSPVILSGDAEISSNEALMNEENIRAESRPGIEFAEQFGDEVALYRSRGIPVVIDPDRRRGITAAIEGFNPDYIILDDGYQNLSVRKDFDILLLDHSDPFGGGRLLPWGRLRESPNAVERADAVIFTRSSSESVPDVAREAVNNKRVYFSSHSYDGIIDREGKVIHPESMRGRTLAIFSGIAVPEQFENMVIGRIFEPEYSFRFSDHHRYSRKDIKMMTGTVGPGTAFLTTGKDWFKTVELFPDEFDIYMVRLRMKIEGMESLMSDIAKP